MLANEPRYTLTNHTFRPAVQPPQPAPEAAYWFAFHDHKLLVTTQEHDAASSDPDTAGAMVPWAQSLEALGLSPLRTQYLGRLDQQACFSAELGEGEQPPPGMKLVDLRRLYGLLDEDFFWIASRAVQIVDWDRTHQFCSVCATPLQSAANERVKICPACGYSSYPRLAPAIIVAVVRGDRLLLARSHRHPPGRFSVLAGFVEPGETLEECLRREVQEEVGIQVKNIRYFGSQPWPFPHSLMIAFTCEYAAGEIVLEEQEMAEAGWYTAGNLPRIPPRISISRALIDWFVDQQNT
jgi:NAD+ diphosphatase